MEKGREKQPSQLARPSSVPPSSPSPARACPPRTHAPKTQLGRRPNSPPRPRQRPRPLSAALTGRPCGPNLSSLSHSPSLLLAALLRQRKAKNGKHHPGRPCANRHYRALDDRHVDDPRYCDRPQLEPFGRDVARHGPRLYYRHTRTLDRPPLEIGSAKAPPSSCCAPNPSLEPQSPYTCPCPVPHRTPSAMATAPL